MQGGPKPKGKARGAWIVLIPLLLHSGVARGEGAGGELYSCDTVGKQLQCNLDHGVGLKTCEISNVTQSLEWGPCLTTADGCEVGYVPDSGQMKCIADSNLGVQRGASGAPINATTPVVEKLKSELSKNIDTKPIDSISSNELGQQSSSLVSAKAVASLGAAQAATVGAIFCAEGANANLTSPEDAAALYANCQQNFDAANKLSGKTTGFNPDQGILQGSAAKQSLEDFERNFGIAPSDYLSKVLGEGKGPSSLAAVLDGKISESKLNEALEAATKLAANTLTESSNAFAVDFGSAQKKPKTTLRDSLKKSLAESGKQEAASRTISSVAPREQASSQLDGLSPLSGGIFSAAATQEELSIFDVVHRKYVELAPRMKPGKNLAPRN